MWVTLSSTEFGSVSNYEQRLISDLRRSQGRAMGKLDARIDRQMAVIKRQRAHLVLLARKVHRLEDLVTAAFLDRDGGTPPPPPVE